MGRGNSNKGNEMSGKPETRGRKKNKIQSEKMGLAIPGPIYRELLKKAGIKTAVAQEIYKILAKELNIDLNGV